ncbi:MAG: hypothetical protein ACT6QO_17035, partial [Brevundimonas aurantiaca]
MTDEKDNNDHGAVPLEPFPTHRPESPFPPLYESLPEPQPAPPPEPGVVLPPVTNPNVPHDPPSDWIQTADAHDLAVTHAPARENALLALGRFAFPPGPPPDDEGLAARDRRWTTRAILTATVFLLIFNAVSPLNWSRQQVPGWLPQTVERLSTVWVEQLSLMRTDDPRQGL